MISRLVFLSIALAFSSQAFAFKAGGQGTNSDPFLISSCTELQAMREDLSANYQLAQDIDCSNFDFGDGNGFMPVGSFQVEPEFSGSLNGKGFTIDKLTINRGNYAGLFGRISRAALTDVILTDVDIQGFSFIGALAGQAITTSIINSHAQGVVSGRRGVGGLVGLNTQSFVQNSSADVAVTATDLDDGFSSAGGLVGRNDDSIIISSHATGNVESASWHVGGLVGENSGQILHSYAEGDVHSDARQGQVGGLVGSTLNVIEQSYATGNVTGIVAVGGLVGSSGVVTISDSYATGQVDGDTEVGGLVGVIRSSIRSPIALNNNYSIGVVLGNGNVGGLVGLIAHTDTTVNNSYWDVLTSGINVSAGGIPSLTQDMQRQAFYNNWDFDDTWQIINEGEDYPTLQTRPST